MHITENDFEGENKGTLLLSGEPRVNIMIAGTGAWEGGINGTFYRISRGVKVSIPTSLAKLIYQNERVSIFSSELLQAYKTPRGKKL
ncbi:MAG: hypothetical protein RRY79_00220 [Clostridia bacterium]